MERNRGAKGEGLKVRKAVRNEDWTQEKGVKIRRRAEGWVEHL